MDKDPFIKQFNNWHEMLSQRVLSLSDGSYDIETISKFSQNLLYKEIICQMQDSGCKTPDAGFDIVDYDIINGCGDLLRQIQVEIGAWNIQRLPPEILSDIYEQYLAKKLKKKNGIYYTPRHIVKFIVDHTLGSYLWGTKSGRNEGKRPIKEIDHISNLRIFDPACGSGIFFGLCF